MWFVHEQSRDSVNKERQFKIHCWVIDLIFVEHQHDNLHKRWGRALRSQISIINGSKLIQIIVEFNRQNILVFIGNSPSNTKHNRFCSIGISATLLQILWNLRTHLARESLSPFHLRWTHESIVMPAGYRNGIAHSDVKCLILINSLFSWNALHLV